jgi:phage shock protein PspC (stress-responsive transcriptional regulator)
VPTRVVPYRPEAARTPTMADMDETATTTAPADAGFDASRLRTVLELRRPVDDRMVAGVCTGLARYLRLDPVVVRVLLATLSVVGGLGLIMYATVWLLTPDEGSDRAPLGRMDDIAEGGTRTVVLLVAAALAVTAIVGPGVLWWGPWPGLVVLGGIAWLLLRDRGAERSGSSTGTPTSTSTGDTLGTAQPDAGTGTGTTAMPSTAGPEQATRLPAGGPGDAPGHGPGAPSPPPPAPPGSAGSSAPPPGSSSSRARRDGGRLTLLALGLVGLVAAGAWITDRAGEPVEAAVIIAIALGVVGAAMVVGTVFGNGRPLILPALLLGAALAVTSAVPTWTIGERRTYPVSAAAVEDSYELGIGRQLVDLGGVTDVATLDGRTVRVETGVGETVVVVPEGVDLTVDADVEAGEVVVFSSKEEHGPGTELHYADRDTAAPDLELVLSTQLGRIEVRRG